MSWFRYYSKKILGPYIGHLPVKQVEKYMAVLRIAYFFSASSLLFLVLKAKSDYDKLQQLESGKPAIQDYSSAHQLMRERGTEAGLIYSYEPGKGLNKIEFNRDEYLQQLERDAFERAKEVQKKALAEGKELPRDVIKLV